MSWFTGLFKNGPGNTDGNAPNQAGVRISKGGPLRYSLQHLQYLYSALSNLQPVKPASRQQVVEILRSISEVIIYGDQRQSNQIFDYFCEKNMLFLFTQMLQHSPGGCGNEIARQIIQTVSILVQNISNPTYLFYLLSNNHINEIICYGFDFQDEDVLAQYSSFVKMLSLMLDENTIQFMFDGRQASFPLYTESVKLLDSAEGMVRTHMRVLVLNVFRMADDAMSHFILSPAHRGVFRTLARFIRVRCEELGHLLCSDEAKSPDHVKAHVADIVDELYFFQDVLESGNLGIRDALSDAILVHFVYPLLIPGLGLVHSNSQMKKKTTETRGRASSQAFGKVPSTSDTSIEDNQATSNMSTPPRKKRVANKFRMFTPPRLPRTPITPGRTPGRTPEKEKQNAQNYSQPNNLNRRSHQHDESDNRSGEAFQDSPGAPVGSLLSLFLLNQVLQATTHWSISRAILETILSYEEIDTSHFIAGFADPMEPEEDDRGHPIAKKARPLVPTLPLPRTVDTSIVTLSEHSGSEISAVSKLNSNGNEEGVSHSDNDRQNAEGHVSDEGGGTDYEEEGQDDEHSEENSKLVYGETFAAQRRYNEETRVFPTCTNIHRLRLLAALVHNSDERHNLLALLLVDTMLRHEATGGAFLAKVGMLPPSYMKSQISSERTQSQILDRKHLGPMETQYRYPVVLVESVLSILAEHANRPSDCRILTFRACAQILLSLIEDQDLPAQAPLIASKHLSVLNVAVLRCSKALHKCLSSTKYLERQSHRFIEIFETEHRISEAASDLELGLISGRSELILAVSRGPGPGNPKSIEDRLPRGDFESIRAILRVFFLLRKLEHCALRAYDIRLQEIDNTSQSLEEASNAELIDQEGELVDLSKRSHVQCRIKAPNSTSSMAQNQRPVFLIVTPDIMSIAEVVQSQKPNGIDQNSESMSGNGLNQVRNASVVPIHLVEAITDGSDPQTLYLTVFSHHRPKLFSSIKYQGSTISNTPSKGGTSGVLALKCWRLTVSFANPAACAWTKATIEKHRAELRRKKLVRYCSLLGVGDLANESAI